MSRLAEFKLQREQASASAVPLGSMAKDAARSLFDQALTKAKDSPKPQPVSGGQEKQPHWKGTSIVKPRSKTSLSSAPVEVIQAAKQPVVEKVADVVKVSESSDDSYESDQSTTPVIAPKPSPRDTAANQSRPFIHIAPKPPPPSPPPLPLPDTAADKSGPKTPPSDSAAVDQSGPIIATSKRKLYTMPQQHYTHSYNTAQVKYQEQFKGDNKEATKGFSTGDPVRFEFRKTEKGMLARTITDHGVITKTIGIPAVKAQTVADKQGIVASKVGAMRARMITCMPKNRTAVCSPVQPPAVASKSPVRSDNVMTTSQVTSSHGSKTVRIEFHKVDKGYRVTPIETIVRPASPKRGGTTGVVSTKVVTTQATVKSISPNRGAAAGISFRKVAAVKAVSPIGGAASLVSTKLKELGPTGGVAASLVSTKAATRKSLSQNELILTKCDRCGEGVAFSSSMTYDAICPSCGNLIHKYTEVRTGVTSVRPRAARNGPGTVLTSSDIQEVLLDDSSRDSAMADDVLMGVQPLDDDSDDLVILDASGPGIQSTTVIT